MRRHLIPAALTLILLCPCAGARAEAVVKKIDYKGWKNCCELSNPLVRVVVVPAIGGRIMEYSIGGENVLWQNESELGVLRPSDVGRRWHNYGGYKAWNAPQALWRTPDNDNFYDYAPAVNVELIPHSDQDSTSGIRVTCAPIRHLGFQFVREIALSDTTSRLRVTDTLRNISDHEIEWAPWGVAQVDAPCWIAFPLNERSKFGSGWSVMWPQNGVSTQMSRVGHIGILHWQGNIEKIGTDAIDGWMAYIKAQLGYVIRWSIQTAGAHYPDGGCSAQFFTSDKALGGYAEMETVAPIRKLAPGDQAVLTADWFLTRLNGETKDQADVMERLKLMQRRGMLPRNAEFGHTGDAGR